MTVLLGLIQPYALRLLAWGAVALAALGLILGAKRTIEKGAEAKVKADMLRENLNDVAKAARARDRVRANPSHRDRLRDKYRKLGGDG